MSYDSIESHKNMVFDHARNSIYEQALRDVVTPDSVVLDLGAGLGLHGLIAASLGARKVFLVEPARILDTTREVIRRSQFADRIECIDQRIETTQLSEQVDIIVSVFTGNFLLMEDLLPSLFNARDRFLKPEGHLIPSTGTMIVAPVAMPEYYREQIERWTQQVNGQDLSLIRTYAVNSPYVDQAGNLKPALLGNPENLHHIDFTTATNADCDANITLGITTSGWCHGCLGWFTAEVGTSTLSTAPFETPLHWSQVFLPLQQPIRVSAGDTIEFHLKRPTHGDWTWTIVDQDGKVQRQSSFLAEPKTPTRILRKSSIHQGKLNLRGQALQQVLSSLNGKTPSEDIRNQLRQDFSELFPEEHSAQQFVSWVCDQYSE